ncbi:InlB B-repeat-containing protein [Anaerosphaera multitolerans]|nr:InlB B-repeat-containing protein [Anaerosphaera multitolerans]
MKKTILTLFFMLCIFFPNVDVYAETKEVSTAEELQTAVEVANTGDIISLADDFVQGNVVLEMPNVEVTVDGGNKIWTEGNFIIKGNGTGSLTIKNLKVDGSNIEVAYKHKLIMNQSENGKLILENIEVYNSTVGAINVNTGSKAQTELNRVYIHDNTAKNTAPAVFVGAGETKSDSHLTINNSTIENNIGTGDNYECGALSGKNYTGNITINNTVFRNNINRCDNTSIYGGGGGAIALHYFYGKVEINNSVFDKNQSNGEGKNVRSTYDGGAIYVLDGRGGAEFNINNSTFSNNIAYDDGGAIMFQGTANPGFYTNIKNSTFVNNKAYGLDGVGYSGGAIQYYKNGGSSQMTNKIYSTTFVGNQGGNENSTSEQRGGAIALHGAGLLATPSAPRYNSLFIGNGVYNKGVLDEASTYKDISNNQKEVAGGANVVNVDKGHPSKYTTKDILGVDVPVLQDNLSKITAGHNDEIIQTIPIKPESIADNTYTGTETIPEVDQRNFKRYKDQGAVEMSWIKYDANGGEFELPELDNYDGSIYYEKDTDGKITKYHTVGNIAGADTIVAGDKELKASREGHKFIGWSTDPDATEPDLNYEVGKEINYSEDNFTLYAVWTPVEKYNITYNGNGNTGGTAPVDKNSPYLENSEVKVMGRNDLTREGYAFKGWNTEADGSGTKYKSGTTFTITEDITLFAQWEKGMDVFQVTYDGNGHTSGKVPIDNTDYGYGSIVTIKGNDGNLEKNGLTFLGWSEDKDALEANFKLDGNGNISPSYFVIEQDTVLYAVWVDIDPDEVKGFYVNYDANGADSGEAPIDNKKYERNEEVIVLGNKGNLSRTGYTFDGWNTEADGNGETYFEGETFNIVENTILYAQWALDTSGPGLIYVTFQPKGGVFGDGSTSAKVIEVVEGETVARESISREGYTFKGWYKDDKYKELFDFDSPINENITLYAKWEKKVVSEPDIEDDEDSWGTIGPIKPDKEKPELNKTSHFGYMVGYPDKTIRPRGDITRAEVTTIFFRMMTDDSRNEYWSNENKFKDVQQSDWYNNAISTMNKAEVVTGYPDGNFKPNANITRGEFATMASRFLSDYGNLTKYKFTDIKGNWAEDAINKLASHGLINGYEDGSFKPNQLITRAEAATLINSILERTPHKDGLLSGMKMWIDNSDSDVWYYVQIQEATNSHEYERESGTDIEKWTKILPVRDWVSLEKEWSNSNLSANSG